MSSSKRDDSSLKEDTITWTKTDPNNSSLTNSSRAVTATKSDINVTPLTTQPEVTVTERQVDQSTKSYRYPTQWKDIIAASVMYYLMLTVSQSLLVAGWPYLLQLDPATPIDFAGYMVSIHRIGHALGTITFAYYTYVKQNFRQSLLFGRILSTVGCFLYIIIEFFYVPARRYLVIVVIFLNSFGEGSACVIRSYVPRISTRHDRQRAYSVVNGANMLAIVSGPMAQILFMFLSARGVPIIFESLRMSLYTGPIWISFLLNLIAIVVVLKKFSEPKMSSIEQISDDATFMQAWKTAFKQITKLDKTLIGVCFVEKCIASIGFVSMITMLSPYIVATFNISPEATVKIVAFGQGACGFVSILTVVAFVCTRLGKKLKASLLFPSALGCYFFMYTYSYPLFGFYSAPVHPKNETTHPYGCNTAEFAWCANGAFIVAPQFWLPFMILLLGIAIPVSVIAFDTIYSHVLGGIDQNLMQGAICMIDDVVSAIAPIIAANSFHSMGPPFWLIFAAIVAVGMLAWWPIYPKLKKMKI